MFPMPFIVQIPHAVFQRGVISPTTFAALFELILNTLQIVYCEYFSLNYKENRLLARIRFDLAYL